MRGQNDYAVRSRRSAALVDAPHSADGRGRIWWLEADAADEMQTAALMVTVRNERGRAMLDEAVRRRARA